MVDPAKFQKTVRRPYPPFYISLIFQAYQSREIWQAFDIDEVVNDLINIDRVWYYTRYYMQEFPKKLKVRLFKNEEFWQMLKKVTLKKEAALLAAVKEDLQTFCQAYREYIPCLGVYFICDSQIENKVKSLLSPHFDEETIAELMTLLSTPLLDNYHKLANQLILKDKQAFMEQFPFLHSRYGRIVELTENDAEILLKDLKASNYLETQEKEKAAITAAIAKAKSVMGDKAFLVDLMQFFIYYRTQRTDVMNRVAYEYADKLKVIAKEKDLTYDELLHCMVDELETPPKDLKERQEEFAFIGEEHQMTILTGKENKEIKVLFKSSATGNKVEGRGTYPGTIRGTARLIFSHKDLAQVQDGEILVTSMTTPDMMPAMHKAAAFVTDEGGITCHAAIVSREMRKPCVIGTKDATGIFKNGDTLLLDASKGVVKKL